MKVIILAAGYGTRLKEIAEKTPKPLLPINDKPLINYIMDRIQRLDGLNEVLVVTNHKFFNDFKRWAESLDFPYPIEVINDGTSTPDDRLGSIGDIQYVLKDQHIQDDVLVVGGDNLFDYNLNQYIIFAQKRDDAVSIGLFDIEDLKEAKLYGVVGINQDGQVISFQEKPETPKSTLISMCFYYFPRKTLHLVGEYLLDVGKSDTAGDYIRWLLEKHRVHGFKFTGQWYDIGSIESYREAREKFLN